MRGEVSCCFPSLSRLDDRGLWHTGQHIAKIDRQLFSRNVVLWFIFNHINLLDGGDVGGGREWGGEGGWRRVDEKKKKQ